MSIDIYSINFKNCKNIYPHKLVRPLGKYKVDNKKHLKEVIDDIAANSLRITQYIADNLKRCIAKDCKCHSSWYACEYCYAKGSKIEVTDNMIAGRKITLQINSVTESLQHITSQPKTVENDRKIENLASLKEELEKSLKALKRKSNILWPSSTMDSLHRSRKSILAIVRRIERGENLSLDESKGVLGRSLLLDIPHFNYIYDAPVEYMHLSCIGVTKRLIECTFNVGTKRSRITKRKLSSPSDFNKLMHATKVTKESSRRARNLDLAVFKAQEYRNCAIFFFPLVLECIEPGAKEINLWLYLAFMLRSSVLPSIEYAPVNLNHVRECCVLFYKLFEELFGKQNCSYSLHVFCSHLTEIRTHGPLTETSAFKFESFYGEVRRSFVSGTTSPLKQIMKNILLKRAISSHVCQNDIFISNYDTPMECNSMIYCYKRKQYYIYQITDIIGDNISCHKIGQYPAHFEETPNLNWSSVGVFKRGGTCSDTTVISKSDIAGKVLNVGKYLVTCPTNVLNEK